MHSEWRVVRLYFHFVHLSEDLSVFFVSEHNYWQALTLNVKYVLCTLMHKLSIYVCMLGDVI